MHNTYKLKHLLELESKYKELVPTFIPTIFNGKMLTILPEVNFGYVENYGNSSEKPRGDKTYIGEYNIDNGSFLLSIHCGLVPCK